MYRRTDPRFTRTVHNLAQTLESANESAQTSLFTFAHDYVSPCFASLGSCIHSCTAPCFPTREDRLRRHRGRSRGRAELSFDFYDDWEEEENDGLLGWGNDELDRLLAGSSSGRGGGGEPPGRQRAMSYGTRRDRDARFPSGRRKSAVQPHDGGPDPTIIPSSSYFGFLGRLPFKIGGKGLRYKPSAADLRDHPGHASRISETEEQPLIEDSDEDGQLRHSEGGWKNGHRRLRSQTTESGLTTESGHTTDSLSSRGDIFPSEDEDDAVPLDDEFTMALERRATGVGGTGADDTSSGKTRSGKRSAGSRVSTRTASSRSTHESGRRARAESHAKQQPESAMIEEVPTLSDLKQEEERLRLEEEAEVERKRYEAQQLAKKRGLRLHSTTTDQTELSHESKTIEETSEAVPEAEVGDPAHSPPLPARVAEMKALTLPDPTSPQSQVLLSPSISIYYGSREESVPFPSFNPQTAPESGAFDMESSELSLTPNRPLSLNERQRDEVEEGEMEASNPSTSKPTTSITSEVERRKEDESTFVPARLPFFESRPD